MQTVGSYSKDKEGTTAIEFSVLAFVFLAFIFGIFEMGRAILTWNSLQYALENATRYVLVNESVTNQEIVDYISQDMEPLSVGESNITVDVTYLTRSSVNFIELDATAEFQTVMPFLPDEWATFTLSGSSSLPIP